MVVEPRPTANTWLIVIVFITPIIKAGAARSQINDSWLVPLLALCKERKRAVS
jgi:hypothetical protein